MERRIGRTHSAPAMGHDFEYTAIFPMQEELADLRRLKEREQELQFELFQARLSAEDLERLEQEARAQVKPHLGLGTERQLAMHKDTTLRQWFVQRAAPSQSEASTPHSPPVIMHSKSVWWRASEIRHPVSYRRLQKVRTGRSCPRAVRRKRRTPLA